jgi:hypothetical protein
MLIHLQERRHAVLFATCHRIAVRHGAVRTAVADRCAGVLARGAARL